MPRISKMYLTFFTELVMSKQRQLVFYPFVLRLPLFRISYFVIVATMRAPSSPERYTPYSTSPSRYEKPQRSYDRQKRKNPYLAHSRSDIDATNCILCCLRRLLYSIRSCFKVLPNQSIGL